MFDIILTEVVWVLFMNDKDFINIINDAVEQAAANMELENYPISDQEKEDLKGLFYQNEKVKVLTMRNNRQGNNVNYGRVE